MFNDSKFVLIEVACGFNVERRLIVVYSSQLIFYSFNSRSEQNRL